ncbi:hypothetical protein HEP81_04622 [Streptomyces griseofuscus]|uniref:Uncharacterized protein n=1 Tax=Streptomyces griseofuscus TaxID=146922 RepID=A0A7H1Q3L5_9ACTN|nr:hypothetical protein [Streptomyces griseofuscus]QNT94895.1 hypothetical protein HEP81_04622 [Streptomyces griseofuscus]
MTTATATATETVARRLRILAGIVQDRAHHPDRAYIGRLVAHLRFASLTAPTYPIEDGRRLPVETLEVLQEARDLMEAHDFHLSPAGLDYAVAPALGQVGDLKPLGAVSEKLARDDFELLKRRNTVIHSGGLDSDDDEAVAWALRALTAIHYKREQLAKVVAVDNARPCNQSVIPYHLAAQRSYAEKAAARARTHEGGKLVVALNEFGIPAFLHEDRGVSCALVAVDRSADEGEAHTGPRVLISSGEHAMRAAGEHDEPWAGHLYDSDGGHVAEVFESPSGLSLAAECAEAALRLAIWLDAHADRHLRT